MSAFDPVCAEAFHLGTTLPTGSDFGGDPGICSGCGVATIATDYYELGRLTGELAAQILRGETDISTLPIQYGAMQKLYNSANCEALNITVPDGYTAVEG